MTADLPDYYFRVRENGAVVFRLGTENRQRRIEMDEIATVNVKNGNIKPHGDVELTEADRAAIGDWLADQEVLNDGQEDPGAVPGEGLALELALSDELRRIAALCEDLSAKPGDAAR